MAQRVARSLTLLWVLVGVAAVVLAAGGIVLGSIMTGALRKQALDDAKTSLALYTSGVLSPRLVEGNELRVGEDVTGLVQRSLVARPDILSVKVWRSDGVLAWASLAPERIGKRFPPGVERPYQRALIPDEALKEVLVCRGTQFVSAVVDPFFEAAHKRPADFGIPEPTALAAS